MSPKIETKYRTFKSDAAPFLFYIDIIPPDTTQYEIKHHVELLKNVQSNPIMPLPLRVDRVFSGVLSTIVRPRKPISFSLGEEYIAIINPIPFVQYGIEKLLSFTEIRASGEFAISLSPENAQKWWNATRFLYGRLRTLEEDFAAFLRAYLHHVLAAKINQEDLTIAAIRYCEMIRDICEQRIEEKHILVEKKDKEKMVDMYRMKEGRVQTKRFKFSQEQLLYPSFVEIEVINTEKFQYSQIYEPEFENLPYKSKVMNYIPLLIYDDLLECMLQNLKSLESSEVKILDPSFLLEKEIILLVEKNEYSPDQLEKYTWLDNFNDIDFYSILKKITPTFLK